MPERLIAISKPEDIPEELKDTPAGLLLEYHNLNRPFVEYKKAELLIGMCMDNRKHLRIPDNFAFIIRTGGANLRYSEFKVSYAVGVGGVKHITLIGHNNCGMVNLAERRELFIDGLTENGGWEREAAAEHFLQYAPLFEIGNEIDFLLSEAVRLRKRYPGVKTTPLLYRIEDNLIYGIKEDW
jgi:carbonic anhydrase